MYMPMNQRLRKKLSPFQPATFQSQTRVGHKDLKQSRGSREPNGRLCAIFFQAWRLPPLPREAPSHPHDPSRRAEQCHPPPAMSSAHTLKRGTSGRRASPAAICCAVRKRMGQLQLGDAGEAGQHEQHWRSRAIPMKPHLMWTESQALASCERRPGRRRERCSFSALVHSFAVIMNVFTGCDSTVGAPESRGK